jgi:hypothetical protein
MNKSKYKMEMAQSHSQLPFQKLQNGKKKARQEETKDKETR